MVMCYIVLPQCTLIQYEIALYDVLYCLTRANKQCLLDAQTQMRETKNGHYGIAIESGPCLVSYKGKQGLQRQTADRKMLFDSLLVCHTVCP